VYKSLGQNEDAKAAYERAAGLNPKYSRKAV